jgi:RimJ/RimL family protein N-acetyltransferase
MLAGNTAGELWFSSDGTQPRLRLLWDQGNNVLYLAGGRVTPSSLESLAGTVTARIQPRALATGATWFKARALTPDLEERLPSLFPGTALHQSQYLFFVHRDELPPPFALATLPEMTLLHITPDVLSSDALEDIDQVRAEIRWMWPSKERFFECGFGSIAVVGNEVVCWCTAEYVSPASCGVGIATAPRYQGQGIATVTAMHFLREARSRGVTVYWECGAANYPSVRVAEKLGFRRLAEETYWVGSFER